MEFRVARCSSVSRSKCKGQAWVSGSVGFIDRRGHTSRYTEQNEESRPGGKQCESRRFGESESCHRRIIPWRIRVDRIVALLFTLVPVVERSLVSENVLSNRWSPVCTTVFVKPGQLLVSNFRGEFVSLKRTTFNGARSN